MGSPVLHPNRESFAPCAWICPICARIYPVAMRLPRRPKREVIPTDLGSSFHARMFRPTHFPMFWHHHPELELTMILAGRGRRWVGESVEEFGPGDCVLLGTDLPHTWKSECGNEPVGAIVVQCSPRLFQGSCAEHVNLQKLFSQAKSGLVLHADLVPLAQEELHRLLAARSAVERLGRLGAVLGYFCVKDAARSLTGGPAPQSSDPRLQKVLRSIEENAHRHLPLAEIAAVAAMTPSAFCRWFRRATCQVPGDYLAEIRIGLACRRLQESDASITDIAFSVGFSSLSQFNRRFSALRACTPSQWRIRSRV